ncbi:hypothetical protein [Cellulomonas sp. KRMCY2]|uniref:hypothetical protein n=1 Tax=Cellulomonas sp. KRMCY2 TaxID=1304865 RepID=UPI0012DDC461|nr:hypothetical protein [Cellulomonas sp. KRMCY2]
MSLAAAEFLERLRALVPEAESTVREHLGDNDEELLLDLLTADLRRLERVSHIWGEACGSLCR